MEVLFLRIIFILIKKTNRQTKTSRKLQLFLKWTPRHTRRRLAPTERPAGALVPVLTVFRPQGGRRVTRPRVRGHGGDEGGLSTAQRCYEQRERSPVLVTESWLRGRRRPILITQATRWPRRLLQVHAFLRMFWSSPQRDKARTNERGTEVIRCNLSV